MTWQWFSKQWVVHSRSVSGSDSALLPTPARNWEEQNWNCAKTTLTKIRKVKRCCENVEENNFVAFMQKMWRKISTTSASEEQLRKLEVKKENRENCIQSSLMHRKDLFKWDSYKSSCNRWVLKCHRKRYWISLNKFKIVQWCSIISKTILLETGSHSQIILINVPQPVIFGLFFILNNQIPWSYYR